MLADLALPHRVIPRIAEFARGGLPTPAGTDDGNQWVDGFCWLYCGQKWTRVLWIGPASVAGVQAPMYACGPCIRELQDRIWQSVLLNDEPAQSSGPTIRTDVHSPAGGRGGRHRGVVDRSAGNEPRTGQRCESHVAACCGPLPERWPTNAAGSGQYRIPMT